MKFGSDQQLERPQKKTDRYNRQTSRKQSLLGPDIASLVLAAIIIVVDRNFCEILMKF